MLATVANGHDGGDRRLRRPRGDRDGDPPQAKGCVEEQPEPEEQEHTRHPVQRRQPCSTAPTAMATPSASTMPAVAPIQTRAQWSLAKATVASIVLSPSSARTNEEMTASSTCRFGDLDISCRRPCGRSRHVHTANNRKAMAAANAIGRGNVSPRNGRSSPRVPCTRNEAMPTPDSTDPPPVAQGIGHGHQLDLSPSSATNTTERLTSVAVSMWTTFRHVADGPIARPVRLRSKVSPTALRFVGRAVRQYVDSTIGATPLR